MLCALIQPMHSNYELRYEQLNKTALLSNRQFLEYLLQLITDHIQNETGSLVIASMLDFLTYTICAPYRWYISRYYSVFKFFPVKLRQEKHLMQQLMLSLSVAEFFIDYFTTHQCQ